MEKIDIEARIYFPEVIHYKMDVGLRDGSDLRIIIYRILKSII